MSEVEKFMKKYDPDNKEYKIISATTLNKVEEEVNNLIKQGYIPIGGINGDTGHLYQAMIKRGYVVNDVTI